MQKTNFKTRLLALLTAAFMLVMCVPFAAFAEKTDPAVREKITVNFTEADGTNTPVTIVKDSVSPTAPKAKGGKWVSESGAPELKGGESLTWTEMDRWAVGDWNNEAFITYNFEPDAKYNKISVSFLNAEGGSIDTAKTIAAGESVTAPTKDGDKNIVGWTIGGKAYTGDWSYESLNALVTDANINSQDKVAYIQATAVYEKESETPRKHFNVTFTVDPDKGSFTKEGAGPVEFKGYEDEVGDQQYNVPAVTAKPGYKFVGWKGQGADVIAWDAEAKTFGVTGLCFYQDGSYEGNASIEAQFEKIEDKKNDNRSSSSSASSSSNKTTTASNEKQVVKAAAAPANTTKVLPKTGASNVAPLLGGSLAVVALLMGYGVYSLVLRKKD